MENKIRNKDEEFLIEAIMILFKHEIFEITKNMVSKLNEIEDLPPKLPFDKI